MGARDEGGAGGEQFLDRVDRLIDGAGGIGLGLAAEGRGGRGLLLRQAIDEVVHDDVGQVDVLARAVLEVIAADRERVAIAAEEEDVQVRPREADAGGQRDRAPVDEVAAVGIDEIGEAGGAADAGESDDVLVRELAALEHLVERGEHGEIAAAGAPGRVVGGEVFLGQLFAGGGGGGGDGIGGAHFKTPWRISFTRNVRPSVLVKLRIFGSQ